MLKYLPQKDRNCFAFIISDVTDEHGTDYNTELEVIRNDENIGDHISLCQRDYDTADEIILTLKEAIDLQSYLNNVIPTMKGL